MPVIRPSTTMSVMARAPTRSRQIKGRWSWLCHAIERGYRVLFTTAAAMIAALTRALTENRLEDKLKLYTIP